MISGDMGTAHLAPEELQACLQGKVAQTSQEHLRTCRACGWLLEMLETMKRQSQGASAQCIARDHLMEVAAKLRKLDDAALGHVAHCSQCAAQLREFFEDFSEEDLPHVRVRPAWQRELAAVLANANARPQVQMWRRPVFAWVLPAATVLLVIAALLISKVGSRNPEQLLARAYEKERLTPMRVRGAGYARSAVTRTGAPVDTGVLPSELLEVAAQARRQLEAHQRNAYWHEILGKVYLLQAQPQRAAAEFKLALAYDPAKLEYRFDLGSAQCSNAIQHGVASEYVAGIDNLKYFVSQRRDDSIALFNLGQCLHYAGLSHEASVYLKQALAAERDSGWRSEIRSTLDQIGDEKNSPLSSAGTSSPDVQEFPQLAAAILANQQGNAATAYRDALNIEREARKSGDTHIGSRAGLEVTYALQRLSRPQECLVKARDLLRVYSRMNEGIRARLLLEAGICSQMTGSFDSAASYYTQACNAARSIKDEDLEFRIAGMRASLYEIEGLHDQSVAGDIEGLQRSTTGGGSAMRAYQFLSDLYLNARDQKENNGATEFGLEAIAFAEQTSNLGIRASANEKVAESCFRTRDLACGTEFWQRASSELAKLDAESQRLYRADWYIQLSAIPGARPLVIDGPVPETGARAALVRENQYLLFPDLLLESRSAATARRYSSAEALARDAAEQIRKKRQNLSEEQARFTWVKDARPIFEQLVEVLLAQGNSAAAFDCWESLRSLERTPDAEVCAALSVRKTEALTVTFARLDDRYVSWIHAPGQQIQVKYIPDASRIDALSEVFASLCSHPDSGLQDISEIGAILVRNLHLNFEASRVGISLVDVEPDAGLELLPFRALPLESGSAFGQTFALRIVPGMWAAGEDPPRPPAHHPLLLTSGEADARVEQEAEFALIPPIRSRIARFSDLGRRLDDSEFVYYIGHASAEESTQAALAMPKQLRICRFVVMAACRTGVSDEADLQAFANLPYRLLQAGVKTVVASRWDVNSDRTGELMRSFSERLRSACAAEALRDASRELSRRGYQHPYYWAAFDVYGM